MKQLSPPALEHGNDSVQHFIAAVPVESQAEGLG